MKQTAPNSESCSQDIRVRRAEIQDHPQILRLLSDLELAYAAMDLECFWVAARGETVLGVAELKDRGRLALLSCVGVREDLRGRGIGGLLVDTLVGAAAKDVYLYTLIPGFFRRFGFEEAAAAPAALPPRSMYGCANCDPSSCRRLVRKRDDS